MTATAQDRPTGGGGPLPAPAAPGGTTPGPAGVAASRRRRRHESLRIGGGISPRVYIAVAASSFLLLFAIWVVITATGTVSHLFLPSPAEVFDRLWQLATDGTLWADIAVSVSRIAVGFILATVIAIPLGILIGTYSFWEAAVEPMVDFVRYMPVVGFIPLTIIWIGIDDSQKWAIIFIGTFFQEVLLVMDNVKRVPRDLVEIGYTLGERDRSILRRIILPSASPGIWDTLRISLGWAWTWIVLAELVAAGSGLGYRITTAQRYFQTDTIIGYLIVLGILGLVTDQVMKFAGRRMFPWAER
jgi:NitT/TauT family transport system permease protein